MAECAGGCAHGIFENSDNEIGASRSARVVSTDSAGPKDLLFIPIIPFRKFDETTSVLSELWAKVGDGMKG
jgi:hypothetical protein